MKFKNIKINNFRKLKNIEFDCKNSINTIVGPNGVGKSSVLDAIRLIKSILTPTFDNEAQQTLQNMGIFSPFSNSVMLDTICSSNSNETIIQLKIELEQEEIDKIKNKFQDFVMLRLQNRVAQNPSNQLNFIAFLSTEIGKQQHRDTHDETDKLFKDFTSHKIANIKLTVNATQIRGENGFAQELITFLFRSTPVSESLFSVFPPDRNFPTGEVQLQLGQNDIAQQIQSYSIQPNLKFHRLKTAIVTYLMMNDNDISSIQNDFKIIFDSLIPGKELAGIKLDHMTGRLSVMIKENSANALYDIDFLSSGEKGLLLTLFLLKRTLSKGGIVLIDEPELHLNPGVCRNIVPFLKKLSEENNVQIILTTHSAEILTSTKDDETCNLLRLIDENTISPILKRDNTEAQDAIKCLGVTTSDLLFNKGVIYLEGTNDEDFINEMLKGIVEGFKIISLGGRSAIESEVEILRQSDEKSELDGYHIFILDLDNRPTKLKDSKNVKIIQWDRYSFENYLINLNILYDVIRDSDPIGFPTNRAEFNRTVKELAFTQIKQIATKDIYDVFVPQSISLQKKELNEPIKNISKILSDKIKEQKEQFYEKFVETEWINEFEIKVQNRITEIESDWEENWKIKCKGKEFLHDVYNHFKLKNFNSFILNMIRIIKSENAEEWNILKSKIEPITIKN